MSFPTGLTIRGGPAVPDAAIDAANDFEAVATWLRAKGTRSRHTFDSYRREAVRLLLWLNEQGLSLADMRVDDVHAFYAHLSDPPAHWLRPRKPRRDETLRSTQVLSSALSPQSVNQARTILGQLCAYLLNTGYLRRNVFSLSAKPSLVRRNSVSRQLDVESWRWLWESVAALPCATPQDARYVARARWVLALLYHTGLRREEAAKARMGDFVRDGRAWSLRVVGKGNKERFVTVNSTLLAELRRYRESLDLEPYPVPTETLPVVMSVVAARRGKELTPRAVGKLVADLSDAAMRDCPDEHIRDQINRMSTHWLRHTFGGHRMRMGAALETTQDELGHADPKTTRIYTPTIDANRRRDAEKLVELNSTGG
ncbi:TPA: tyrosine-type recombinase/integrase [Xanthomonas vasicola pv. zeae]|nr:tyrosine-type recombinase/integrase [Xanthomonas vasicola]HHZ24284.1 tyrosine-type recombinase/integrase [Xanthomonas vasicola pv. zeae]HHZ28494.1 tyrosine-type recombinase/integrase [Xanthomonas vasicola pv. zeae]HHZ52734.1 tyrosine-type recombinase/integrase [Xanthomonas vasicola pv. zeae]